jgi:hypothetical protein
MNFSNTIDFSGMLACFSWGSRETRSVLSAQCSVLSAQCSVLSAQLLLAPLLLWVPAPVVPVCHGHLPWLQ